MYCPVCYASNGDFAIRCRHCGQQIAVAPPSRATEVGPKRSRLTTVLIATSIFSTVVALALAGMISERHLWEKLATNQATNLGNTSTPTMSVADPSSPDATPAAASRPMPATALDVGQVGVADRWKFVVDQVSVLPDDTMSDWAQAVVTYTIQNGSARTARLDIPSTVSKSTDNNSPTHLTPRFVPLPLEQQPGSVTDGLRLSIVDGSGRKYGGGFGDGTESYQAFVAPGDALRLTYRFRFPQTTTGPFVLHCAFMPALRDGNFDIHLDRSASNATRLTSMLNPVDLSHDTWVTIGGEWAVTSEGVEFSPGHVAGDQPVTVHLRVTNLTSEPMPALTDRRDAGASLRDFYLTDEAGNIAYTHSDNEPGVIVPAGATRAIMVQLFTHDLPSTAKRLTFTAVLNWETNLYTRFRLS